MQKSKRDQYFKGLLSNYLLELQEKGVVNRFSGITETSELSPDFSDQASAESDMDFNLHMKERDGNLIVKIKAALERIEEGTYGICENCGEKISTERLKARPVTTLCISCKKKQATQEKLRSL